MDQNTCEEISRLLNMYNFDIDETIDIEIICSICKKIMTNAYKGPCDCRYCLKCIERHIENFSEFCPGPWGNCKTVEINLQSNLIVDKMANMAIADMIVKCPTTYCDFKGKLIEMGNHMRLCNLSITNCPFLNMGCKQCRPNENMKQHLLMEIVSHTEMLMEFNNNLKNEIGELKEKYEKLNNENESLKSQLINQENLIKDFKENNLLITTLFENIDLLKNQFEELKVNCASKEKKQQDEFLELKQKLNLTDKNQAGIQSRLNEGSNSKITQIDTDLINMKVDMYELKVNTNKINIIGEFVWKVDKVSQQRKNKWNYSKSFYSHKDGYKMCMGMSLNEQILNVGLCIMRGEHDNSLVWPFDRAVVIELINQLTNTQYKRKILQYSTDSSNSGWSKPLNERNEVIGCYSFIQMNELKNNSEIYRNDQIIIKCSLNT